MHPEARRPSPASTGPPTSALRHSAAEAKAESQVTMVCTEYACAIDAMKARPASAVATIQTRWSVRRGACANE